MIDMEKELQNLKEQMKTIEMTLFGPMGDNGMYKDVQDIKKIMVTVMDLNYFAPSVQASRKLNMALECPPSVLVPVTIY